MTTELHQPDITENEGDTPVVEPDDSSAKRLAVDEPDEATMKAANKEVREYADRTKAENKTLREGALRTALSDIGLNYEEGLGVAIAESYSGEITAEALGAFALEKYKHQAAQAPVPAAVVTSEKIETLNAQSSPVTEPEPKDEPAIVTAKMDDPESGVEEAKASIVEKMTQFNTEHYLPKNQQ